MHLQGFAPALKHEIVRVEAAPRGGLIDAQIAVGIYLFENIHAGAEQAGNANDKPSRLHDGQSSEFTSTTTTTDKYFADLEAVNLPKLSNDRMSVGASGGRNLFKG
ncbi:uncharacterized protein PpBr36_09941 [Pyricularia pennisetigena]|uniref:uncharacterized protein n=1 Tax=Pyricularia pennisetigena TaxID=1578925 RepID=UPI001150B53A|nr:uncharacterized protein PpBr36_09941 [Pyricularia pennisetigena]TLS22532.1 hypothetical protein PpBr36_09941 [Pyricularia pennisetigena]